MVHPKAEPSFRAGCARGSMCEHGTNYLSTPHEQRRTRRSPRPLGHRAATGGGRPHAAASSRSHACTAASPGYAGCAAPGWRTVVSAQCALWRRCACSQKRAYFMSRKLSTDTWIVTRGSGRAAAEGGAARPVPSAAQSPRSLSHLWSEGSAGEGAGVGSAAARRARTRAPAGCCGQAGSQVDSAERCTGCTNASSGEMARMASTQSR